MSMNLRFLNVGSAAALATTVTGIKCGRLEDGRKVARDGNQNHNRVLIRSEFKIIRLKVVHRTKPLEVRTVV